MATFTILMKHVVESHPDDIGLNDYPIFDEEYRELLNKKIVDHFYMREIGQESISLFKFFLKRKMNEIMPYYNQQYELSRVCVDPLKTISIKNIAENVAETESTGSGTSGSTSNSKSRAVASSLPQVMLSGNGDYAESAQDNTSNTTGTGTSSETQATNSNGTVDSETSGYQGNPANLIYQMRQTLVNTDMDVINELEPLFMLIWSSGDEQVPEGYGKYYGHHGYGFAF